MASDSCLIRSDSHIVCTIKNTWYWCTDTHKCRTQTESRHCILCPGDVTAVKLTSARFSYYRI